MHYLSRFSLFVLGSALVVGCGSDPSSDPAAGEDDNSSETGSETPDASVKDAGKSSTSVKDASAPRTTVDAGSHTTGSPSADAAPAQEPHVDAGTGQTTEDAGKADAGHVADAGHAADAGSGSTCDTLTYDSFGQMFLSNYCTTCHGATMAQAGIKLDSLANVQTNKSKAKSEVTKSSMPPRGAKAPTAAERTQFGQWIDCGPK